MAFSNSTAASSNTQRNDAWKAQAFLNFYLTLKSGKRVKVGAIPLKQSNALHAQLIAKLDDPERLQKFINQMEVNFQLVGDVQVDDLDL